MGICVAGSGSPRSWCASSITQRLGMPLPHESHHLPAVVINHKLRIEPAGVVVVVLVPVSSLADTIQYQENGPCPGVRALAPPGRTRVQHRLAGTAFDALDHHMVAHDQLAQVDIERHVKCCCTPMARRWAK
jgi:hypothetical protein